MFRNVPLKNAHLSCCISEIVRLLQFCLRNLSDYEHFISGNPHNIAANLYMQLSLKYPILESLLIMTLLTFSCREVVSFLSPLTAPFWNVCWSVDIGSRNLTVGEH